MSRRWLFWPALAAGGEQEVSRSVAASTDDAVETVSTGAMSLNSASVPVSAGLRPAFRFLDLTIPQGATIVDAFIQFTAHSNNQSAAITLNIVGQAADTGTFTSTTSDITARAKTTASVSWTPATFVAAGDRLAAQQTPDIKSIVQEIVNSVGWASGNAIVFILEQTSGGAQRTLRAWDHTALAAATLTVRYTT